MNSNTTNHDIIYEKLAKVLRVKFKTQLKGTEIHFRSFYLMKNIVTDKEDYLVIFEDSNSIKFSSLSEFLDQFISIVESKIDLLDKEYEQLQNAAKTNLIIDRNEMYMRHEHIGYYGDRLQKLLDKLKKFLNEKK